MKSVRRTWYRIRHLFGRRQQERDLREELAWHVEMQTEENRRAGMDADTARRLASIKLGGMRAAEDAWRDQRGVRWLEETARDLRLGLRAVTRSRSFAAVAVLTLGVTIGLNLAIYALVDSALRRPLLFEDERLRAVVMCSSGRR